MSSNTSCTLVDFELPGELLDLVLSHTSRDTLRNSRLASRSFNELAQRHLFKTVYLKVNLDSFIKLENISRNEQLRSRVQKLVYDPALLPWALETFDLYLEEGVGTGFSLASSDSREPLQNLRDCQREFASLFTELELQNHWQQYARYLLGQKYLHRGENELEHLTALFKQFRQLEHVEIATCVSEEDRPKIAFDTWQNPANALECASHIARKTLIEPGAGKFRMKRILTMMQAAQAASLHIKCVETGQLKVDEMDAILKMPNRHYLHDFLLGLTSLQMNFAVNTRVEDAIEHLHGVVSLSRNLETLDLTGNIDTNLSNTETFPNTSQMQWPRLKKLRLSTMNLDRERFSKFLLDHTTSLESLTMNDLHLNGSFIEILIMLSEKMMLKDLNLSGSIGDEGLELWRAQEPTLVDVHDLSKSANACLLHRIKDYVLIGAVCPFRKPHQNVKERVQWLVDTDATFYPETERGMQD